MSKTRIYWFDDNRGPMVSWQTMAELTPMEHDDIPERIDWANKSLSVLTKKQRFVMECLYGLKDGNEYTQDEVAGLMGVSQIAVQRLHKRALRQLRKGVIAAP